MSQRAVLLLLCPPVLSVPGPAAALGPSDTLHLPSSSALAGRGDWLPELAEGGTVTSPPYFAALHPLQFLPMCQAQVQRPWAPGAGPWVPARRRCTSKSAHSVISLVH